MLFDWNKFMGWKVLEFFLETGGRSHVNGLAKELGVSSGTAQRYLAGYERQGILKKEKTANVVSYELNHTPLTLELKRAFIVSKLMPFVEEFKKENPYVTTIALYGSHAKGSYDSRSDLDLLAISQDKKPALESLKKMEEKTGKAARLQVFTLAEWKALLRKNDSFAVAVSRNNILLFGEPL